MKRPSKWKDLTQVKGAEAARLRQRKYALIDQFKIPDGLLPGTICISYRRCGHNSCHCATGQGHESWSWTFMMDGHRRVEYVPADKVEEVRRRVEAGREFQDAVREVLTANAKLLILEKQQRRAPMKKR